MSLPSISRRLLLGLILAVLTVLPLTAQDGLRYGRARDDARELPDWVARGLIRALADPNPETRRKAVRCLDGVTVPARHRPRLVEILAGRIRNDPGDSASMTALCMQGEDAAGEVHLLLERAFAESGPLRKLGARELARLGPTIVTELREAFARADDEQTGFLLDILEKLGPAASPATREVTPLLGRTGSFLARNAMEALVAMGPDCIPAILPLLDAAAPPEARKNAIRVLARVGPEDDRATRRIVDLLGDEDQAIRQAALWALVAMTPDRPEIAHAIMSFLVEKTDDGERLAALAALEACGSAAAAEVETLRLFLEPAADSMLDETTFSVLAAIGPVALPILGEQLAPGKDEEWCIQAIRALGRIGPPAADLLLSRIGDGPQPLARAAAIEELSSMSVDIIPQLLPFMEESGGTAAHQAAVSILARLETGATVDGIFEALDEKPDDSEKEVLLEALRRVDEHGRVPVARLVPLVAGSRNPWVRRAALLAIADRPDEVPEILSLVEPLLEPGTDDRLIEGALAVVRGLGPRAAPFLSRLRALLERPSGPDRVRELLRVLEAIGPEAAQLAPTLTDYFLELKDDFSKVRLARALAAMGPGAADQIPRLLEACEGHPSTALLQLITTIGPAGTRRHPEVLVELVIGRRTVPISDFFVLRDCIAELVSGADVATIELLMAEANVDMRSALVTGLCRQREPPGIDLAGTLCPDARSEIPRARLDALLLGADRPDTDSLLRWLGQIDSADLPAVVPAEMAKADLRALSTSLARNRERKRVAEELEDAMVEILGRADLDDEGWTRADRSLLEELATVLAGGRHRPVVEDALARFDLTMAPPSRWWWVLGGHTLFWGLLIFVYPRSRVIQGLYFWHPLFRWFACLGYVEVLIRTVPFLQRRIFAPFRASLLSDAEGLLIDEQAYFGDSRIRRGKEIVPALASLRGREGRVIIEGESGLGKSLLLARLARSSPRLAVFLPAGRCTEGPLKAIQAKLDGPAAGEVMVRHLLHTGALQVFLDGLNEVNAETRGKIIGFVESQFRGSFVIGSQPLRDDLPAGVERVQLLPLADEQARAFLVGRESSLPESSLHRGDDFRERCARFLEIALVDDRDRALRQRLANPMDLTFIAELIARGVEPDLMALSEQIHEVMAADFERTERRRFPLEDFAESVYERTLAGDERLETEAFARELVTLVAHKIVLARDKDRVFRHDKLRDYYLAQALNTPERQEDHVDDPRFRGAYLLLALRLPLTDARLLRDRVNELAAASGDHILSDQFLRILKDRSPSRPAPPIGLEARWTGDGQVLLRWRPAGKEAPDLYRVYLQRGRRGRLAIIDAAPGKTTELSLAIRDDGKPLAFSIAAENEAGEGERGPEVVLGGREDEDEAAS